MSHFSVQFDRREGPAVRPVRVLALTGELDAHTAPDFEAALQTCLDSGDACLVADGSALDYVSSAGLGVFMAFVEPARAAGGDLKIAALPDRVFEVFDLLGFPSVFDMVPTVEAAVAAFDDAPEGSETGSEPAGGEPAAGGASSK